MHHFKKKNGALQELFVAMQQNIAKKAQINKKYNNYNKLQHLRIDALGNKSSYKCIKRRDQT